MKFISKFIINILRVYEKKIKYKDVKIQSKLINSDKSV